MQVSGGYQQAFVAGGGRVAGSPGFVGGAAASPGFAGRAAGGAVVAGSPGYGGGAVVAGSPGYGGGRVMVTGGAGGGVYTSVPTGGIVTTGPSCDAGCGPECGCGGAGCGGAGCGAAGCAASAGCGGVDSGVLRFVGQGGGDYVAETTYTYVGAGRGNLAVLVQRQNMLPCMAVLAVLIILAVIFLAWPRGTSTTYKLPDVYIPDDPVIEEKECVFWGDPHVVTFDGARPSFYGEGEYWIVKSDRVRIQGRYAGTKYTFGLASTQKIAITGDFIGGHFIEVEPLESQYGGNIRVDHQAVLSSHGSMTVGGATIVYNGQGELPDSAASRWARNVVHLSLPEGIHMEIFRWGNYLDLRIRMRPLEGGQDGSCGNFNGDVNDDSTAAIFARIGARVASGENLFQHRDPVDFTQQMQMMLDRDCDETTKSQYRLQCYNQLGRFADEHNMKACLFDNCFGAQEHALQTAKTYATQAERIEVGLE